jgi:cation diffusion facilitator family transporter
MVSASLAALGVGVGLWSGSTAVVAIGFEFAGDVLASAVVLAGLFVASRPPDANHPYGHGRVETVAGLLVGFILVVGGAGIVWRSVADMRTFHAPPGMSAVAVLIVAIVVRSAMAVVKFRVSRRIGSVSLAADAWNDAVDILSAAAALVAVGLARAFPAQLMAADQYGGIIVGAIVMFTGLRIVRGATLDLADTMPDPAMIARVRGVAMRVPGVLGVEKQFARKTGLQYHIDLHLEVDPAMTVRESHRIAHEVQARVRADVPWVADVLIHVEPAGGVEARDAT